MKKFLFILVAFSILDQSIDFDYCLNEAVAHSSYDDIDSVYELLVEKLTGDPNYTGEDEDDDASPKNSQVQNEFSFQLYCQELKMASELIQENTATIPSSFIACLISKGHYSVVSPPPDPGFLS